MTAMTVSDVPTLTVTMPDLSVTENITNKQLMMSSCTGAVLTSLFSKFSVKYWQE